jgi:hypothetical protein
VTTQLVGHRHHVDRPGRRVDRPDRVEDVLMSGAVEVPDLQPGLADDPDGVTRQQQGTEDRFLGLQVVRRDPAAPTAGRGGSFGAAGYEFTIDRHGEPTLSGVSCAMEGEQPWVLSVDGVWTTVRNCGPTAVDSPVDRRGPSVTTRGSRGRPAGRQEVRRQPAATTSMVIGNDTSLCNDAVTVCWPTVLMTSTSS